MSLHISPTSEVHAHLYEMAKIPVGKWGSSPSQLICGETGTIRIDRAGALQADGRGIFVRSLHQIGSPLVDLRIFRLPDGVAGNAFPPAYGAGTDRPLLNSRCFSGFGIPIQRDDPQITGNYHRISSLGFGPWLRPGFPALARFQDWFVEGARVRGVLASSVDRPGGFVVLDSKDLCRIMGYEPAPSFSEQDLDGLIPYECLCRIFDWAEPLLSRFSSNFQTRGDGFEPVGSAGLSQDRAPAR